MNETFFTICVPSYNAVEYLPSLLQSVKNQIYSNWNIVIVDDLSTDETLNYLQNQELIPSNKIIYFQQEKRKGPFNARRKAFSLATGDYILCIDADDELLGDNVLSELNSVITKNNPDVVMFNITRDKTSNTRFIDYKDLSFNSNGLYDRDKILEAFLATYSLNNLASKAIKQDLFLLEEVKENFIINEDRYEFFNVLKRAKTFFLIDEPFYFYRTTESSTTESKLTIQHFEQVTKIEKTIYKYALQRNIKTENELLKYLSNVDDLVLRLIRNDSKKDKKDLLRIGRDPFFKHAVENCDLNLFSPIMKLSFELLYKEHIGRAYFLSKTRLSKRQGS